MDQATFNILLMDSIWKFSRNLNRNHNEQTDWKMDDICKGLAELFFRLLEARKTSVGYTRGSSPEHLKTYSKEGGKDVYEDVIALDALQFADIPQRFQSALVFRPFKINNTTEGLFLDIIRKDLELVIFYEKPEDEYNEITNERWYYLTDTNSINFLKESISLLMVEIYFSEIRELDQKCNEYLAETNLMISEYINQATNLNKEIGSKFIDLRPSAFQITGSVLNEIFGPGWKKRLFGSERKTTRKFRNNLGQDQISRGNLRNFITSIEEFPDLLPLNEEDSFLSVAVKCFEAVLSPLDVKNKEKKTTQNNLVLSPRSKLFSLLPNWVRLHEIYRELSLPAVEPKIQVDDLEKINKLWLDHGTLSLVFIKEFLISMASEGNMPLMGNKLCSKKDSIWIYLWFLDKLLDWENQNEVGLYGIKNKSLTQYRAELAFALRELIRISCHPLRIKSEFNEETFLESLRFLVRFHAHHLVGLPLDLDLRNYFLSVKKTCDQENNSFSIKFFKNLINSYILGHFLLDCKINQSGKSSTSADEAAIPHNYCQLLVSAAKFGMGANEAKRFRQAFSLAVLFQNSGQLMFPFVNKFTTSFATNPGHGSQQRQSDLEETLQQAGFSVTERCISELKKGKYFNVETEVQLSNWLDDQLKHGTGDHGLFSAWFLHDFCKKAELSLPEFLPQTIRALLLRNASTVIIDSRKDLVASYLAFINEIYDWDLGWRMAAPFDEMEDFRPVTVTRSLDTEICFDSFTIKGLYLERNGKFQPHFKIPKLENAGTDFPSVTIHLQKPENLPIPVFLIWLIKAQNLGRLTAIEEAFYPPAIILSNSINQINTQIQPSSLESLEMLAHFSHTPIRPAIATWLRDLERFQVYLEKGLEEVVLSHLEQFPFKKDIRNWVPQLLGEISNLLKNIDLYL